MSDFLDYAIVRTARRSVQIQVNADASISVRAPKWVSKDHIHRFIQSKSNWIIKKQSQIQQRLLHQSEASFELGYYYLYLGRYYQLHASKVPLSEPVAISDNMEISLESNLGLEKTLNQWYRKKALTYFEQETIRISRLHGLSFSEISLSQAKRRWGTCTAQKKIRLNWRLILAPESVIEYVICHELAHTRHFHHQRSFWKLVESMCPNWKSHQAWLSEFGHFLHGSGVVRPLEF